MMAWSDDCYTSTVPVFRRTEVHRFFPQFSNNFLKKWTSNPFGDMIMRLLGGETINGVGVATSLRAILYEHGFNLILANSANRVVEHLENFGSKWTFTIVPWWSKEFLFSRIQLNFQIGLATNFFCQASLSTHSFNHGRS